VSRGSRIGLFAATAPIFAALVFWGLAGLPDFGHYNHPYGKLLSRAAPVERHTSNVVSATTFDYRGFDTLGEEFILFASAMGVALLLRDVRDVESRRPYDRVEDDAVQLLGILMVPVTVLLGLWLAAYGYITPGGGFQGGVVLAGGLVLLWAAGRYRAYRAASPIPLVELAEGVGAGGYVVVGLAALVSGAPFLQNLFGPGHFGTLLSGGSIPFLNWAAAIEVAAANVLLYNEVFEEYVLSLRSRR
jgi:multicomponent Na+:H+ antiporter subunit B